MSARAPTLTATGACLVVGAIVAFQARVNGDLAGRLGGGFRGGAQAALVNFTIGLLLVSLIVLAVGSLRTPLVALLSGLAGGTVPRWQALAGLGGAFLILAQSASVGALGVAVFTVAVVAGQTTGGLAVDDAGLGPTGRQPLTTQRVAACALAVAAVVVSVSGRFGSAGFSPALVILCVLAGGGVAVQSALNGRVGQVCGSALVAAWLNFAVGTAALAAVVGLGLVTGHHPHALPGTWWLYLGGPLGLAFVTVVAASVRVAGVLLVSLATVAGQVAGAVVLDAVAAPAGQSLHAVTVLAAVATVGAVLLAARSAHRPVGTGSAQRPGAPR